jgi:hypothetical protein
VSSELFLGLRILRMAKEISVNNTDFDLVLCTEKLKIHCSVIQITN